MKQKPSTLFFFFIVFLFESALTAYLILDHRMVIGHDGFQVFSHLWFFHNSKIIYGQMPLWTPYIAHGTPMAWWYVIQGTVGISANALLLFSHWLRFANFLPIFHGEFFVEKIMLLIGVWLLGKRYFASTITLFFVATCVMSSCVVLSQYKFTLTLFYALPLILYLFHRFFDTGRGGWFFGASYLFILQTLGNDASFIPVFSLTIFVYFISYFYNDRQSLISSFQKIHTYRNNLLWALGLIILFALWITLVFLAKDPQIAYFDSGRNSSGDMGLDVFLTYAGSTDLWKWWEMLLRISPAMDYTVYIGMLGWPLVLVGAFCSKNSNKYPFAWSALFLLIFSLATPLSALAYYFWPLMKFYRHIGLIAPLIKLYLCFLAGFGFEHLFYRINAQDKRVIFYQSILVAGMLYLNSLFLCQLCIHTDLGSFMVAHMISHELPRFLSNFSFSFVSKNLFNAALISYLMSMIVFVRPWIPFSRYSSFILIILIVHCLDVYSYAFQQEQLRSFSLTSDEYALMNFNRIPFIYHRLQDTKKSQNARQKIVDLLNGSIYDSSYNFTLIDALKTPYRSDFCLRPLTQLEKISDNIKPLVLLKLVGATEDKIQFFSHAYKGYSNKDIILAMKEKNYTGDLLLYQSPDPLDQQGITNLKSLDLSQNLRLKIPFKILLFSPNEIIVSVDTLGYAGVWMQYCDVWHPSWKAEINGRSQKIYIGNLAYKALPLEKGKNIVRLYYESKPLIWFYDFFMFSSFLCIIFSVGLLFI